MEETFSLGWIDNILLGVLALLPVCLILYYIYRKDRRKEPLRTLAIAFGWGFLTTISAIIIEFSITADSAFVENYFVIALTEEGGKMAVLLLYIWKHKDFDDSFDAIVYSVAVSLGFAASENLFYVYQNGYQVALMRALLSVPGHACFAIFMGYYFGQAKTHFYYGRRPKMMLSLAKSLGLAIMVHGTYDYLLTSPSWFVFFLLFVVAMDVAAFRLVRMSADSDRPMITDI